VKILWLSHLVPYPPTGGALQRAFHLLRHAAERHEVHLLALHQPRLLPTAAELADAVGALSRVCASVRVFPLLAERSRLHRSVAAARSAFGAAPFDTVWLHSTRLEAAVAEWRRDPEVALVHVDTIGLWQYVDGWAHTPLVLGHHNVESALIARRAAQEPTRWRRVLLRRDARKLAALEARAAPRAAVNIVVSRLDSDRLGTVAPGATIEIVGNGVDPDYWQPPHEPGPRGTLIFAGTLGWYPNRDALEFLLAEIWPALLATRADRRLIVVGRDPGPAARAAAAADTRVEVSGFVPDVRPFLRAAGIYVCPIRVGGGTRLKVLDALAMAKPLVATAVAVEGLDLEEGVHYLRADTAAEFVAQIDRLERSSALRQSLGAAGRQLVVDRYDWRAIGRQLDAAYARARAGASSALGASA
jgi:glycosyltransferase involved in cell wall biosynthesis